MSKKSEEPKKKSKEQIAEEKFQRKLNKILKFRPKHFKNYLNIEKQLEKLKSMNFKIDVKKSLVMEKLNKENFLQYVKSYEDIFVTLDSKFDKQEIIINKNSKVKAITKHIKPKGGFKYSDNLFSDLVELEKLDEDLGKYLFMEIKKIELIIKNKLIDFLVEESGDTHWSIWLLKNSKKHWQKELIKWLYKYQIYKLPVYYVIHELSLGQLKQIVNAVFKSEILENDTKINLCKLVFVEGLGKKVYLKRPDYDDLLGKLNLLNHIRNSVMHFERFWTFLLKERLDQMKLLHNDGLGKFKFYFIKNYNSDLSIKIFIKNNPIFNNLKKENSTKLNDEKLKQLQKHQNQLLNRYFCEFKIGYYIISQNFTNNSTSYVEFDIINNLSWWFVHNTQD